MREIENELNKLYSVQQKIIQFSNGYYRSKKAIRRGDVERLHAVLHAAEGLFPNCIVMLHSDLSERVYVSKNVAQMLQYDSKQVVKFSDLELISRIHPDDVMPVRKAMEQVYSLTQESGYEHESVRYQINLRYQQLGGAGYAHISYEAVTIQFEGYYADVALIRNISEEQRFQYVKLLVYKRTDRGFLKIKHYVPEQKHGDITPRQYDIIRLTVQGLSNQEIANQLHVSINTVKNHKRSLFLKANVKTSVQLVNAFAPQPPDAE